MEENKNNKSDTKLIVGLILLIVALVLAIKMIFAGLAVAIPQQPAASQSVQAETPPAQSETGEVSAPHFCPFCGDELPGSFRWEQFCPYCGEKVTLE